MLVMTLDLEDLAKRESCEIPDFVEQLLTLLPGLWEHHCGVGRRGGFVERLRTGTYFGHIVEHVALELSDAAGISVNRGKTVAADSPGVYRVAVAYKSEHGMRRLLQVAVDLVQSLIDGNAYPLDEHINNVRAVVAEYDLGPSTRAVVDAAERRGIPWRRVNDGSLVRLGYGTAVRHIQATTTDRTSLVAVDLAGNKELTKQVLAAAGLPVPRGCVVSRRDEAIACVADATTPLVVKPLDGNQGKGVSLNLQTPQQVGDAFDLACEISNRVIVEEMYRGNDYRVVVVNGTMVAAAQRIPAHVWGDGVHTIAELIDETNHDPRRGNDHEKPLTKIKTDPLVLSILKRAQKTLDDVPPRGEMVLLRDSANLSTGGEARDVTDHVHPHLKSLCERAARVVGLDICGVDLVLPDIEKPYAGTGGIVEVNAAPGIRMHHYPSEGKPRDVGAAIVDMLYPDGATGRIPLISITGTNGKTTVTRLIRHLLSATGKNVGMTTTDGIWIGDEEVARGDMTGPWSAGVVLADPSVEVAVLETARGGIVRSGLGYDWADVAVMTNIAADHIGQDGIETLDDIAYIKRLVAERVREGGTLVLNADDEILVRIPEHPRVSDTAKQIVYFSIRPHNPHVERHLSQSGTSFVVNGAWIEERKGHVVSRLARLDSIPATLGGTAEFQIYNVLAAAAAARACGVDPGTIGRALSQFALERDSAGRVNLFALNDGYVLIDYGHNPAALQAISATVSRWNATRVTQVVAVPGDRSDALIKEAARAITCADRVIVREDDDLRGREPGQVAELLRSALRQEKPDLAVSIVLDELDALKKAVSEMRAGEVVVALSERVAEGKQWLLAEGATPVTSFQPLTAAGAGMSARIA
jgi:cyanophycin synthetase